MIQCETDLVNYLKDEDGKNWCKHFPNFKLIAFNYPVFGCISREKIGIVDIFCQKNNKGQKYFIEVKYDIINKSGDFWDSLKVIGYTQSQNMYNFNNDIKPAIMIRKNILRYDYRAILGFLGISWFAFTIREDNQLSFELNLL